MSLQLGDYAEDYATLNFKFTTRNTQGNGSPPFALASGAVSVYKGSGTTQSTAGITLASEFDSVVGLTNILIDLSSDAFYATGQDYHVVITTGTVNSISVVGEVVASFSIENRFMRGTDSGATAAALTTVDNEIATIDGIVDDILLDTAGIAGSAMRGTDNAALATALTTVDNEIATIDGIVDDIITTVSLIFTSTSNIEADTNELQGDWTNGGRLDELLDAISPIVNGVSDSGTSTTMVDAARTEADDNYWNGDWILFTSGNISGQCRRITDFVASSDTITFEPATTQAVTTQTYEILPASTMWTADEQNQVRQALGVDGGKASTASGDITAILTDTGTTLPALLPSNLASGRMRSDVLAVGGSTANATLLGTGAGTMISGTVDHTAFTATTTIFESDDITTAAPDHFNKRTVCFTSGTLNRQAREIEDYVVTGGRGRFTVSALTSAPADDVTFVVF